jgi:hypothetical protein
MRSKKITTSEVMEKHPETEILVSLVQHLLQLSSLMSMLLIHLKVEI